MKVYNSELFPALDDIIKAFNNNSGDERATATAMNLYEDAYISHNRPSFAHSVSSYLFDRSPSRGEALQALHCTYGLLSNEWEYRTDWKYCNTVYFISHHKGDGTIIAVGVGEKFNKSQVISCFKKEDWRIEFFNAQH